MMILGVLGGMGPMATVDFMTKVIRNTPASRDQDHVAMVVCSATYVPDRSDAIGGHGDDPFPAMLDALQRLERAGADCIAIPCNTAHHWHGALQARTTIPILHIVDAVVDLLARQGLKNGRIGLLATDGTIAADVYPKRLGERGFSCVIPDAAAQADIMGAIRLVKAGRMEEGARILETAARDMTARDCCRVAMACTEIPLALATIDEPLRSRLVDPTDALAYASVDMCLPHRLATKAVVGQRCAGLGPYCPLA